MRQWTRQPDFIRLIYSYRFWLSIAGVTAVVMGSNLTEIEQQWQFLRLYTVMDMVPQPCVCSGGGSVCEKLLSGYRTQVPRCDGTEDGDFPLCVV